MLKVASLPVNEKKIRLKKNAMDPVDIQTEKKMDPKYKTEMCKSWTDTNFCVYGNKCRFAHGKQELFSRPVNATKYKLKDCKSFKEQGVCMYGSRCNFKHDERKLDEMDRTYYDLALKAKSLHEWSSLSRKRLPVFQSLISSGTSTCSNTSVDMSTGENSLCSPVSKESEGNVSFTCNTFMPHNYLMGNSNVNMNVNVSPFNPYTQGGYFGSLRSSSLNDTSKMSMNVNFPYHLMAKLN